MKKCFFFIISMLLCSLLEAKTIEQCITNIASIPTADRTYSYTLSIGDTTGVSALQGTHEYPYRQKEFEWAVRYATLNEDEARQIDEGLTYDLLRDAIESYCSFNYQTATLFNLQGIYLYDNNDEDSYNNLDNYHQQYHNRLLENKTFRKFAFKLAKQLVKQMVEFYPKDYKDDLLMQINYVIDVLDNISNHNYRIVKESNEYHYSWYSLYEDGKENFEKPYTIEGFIIRRLLMNNIPLDEMKQMAKEMQEVVQKADNSKNADVMFCYRLNDDIALLVGCVNPYFVSYIPHEEISDKGKPETVYTQYDPFVLYVGDKMNGLWCDMDIFITTTEQHQHVFFLNNEQADTYNLNIYKFLAPRYGFGNCFIENNVREIKLDGMFRIYHKRY